MIGKPCPKCHNGILAQAIINGQNVIVCHRCKTVFEKKGSREPSIIQMEMCAMCGTYYFKQNPETVCCDGQVLVDEKVKENE